MQLFIGGAFAGKRAAVRARFDAIAWHSAYRGAALAEWPVRQAAGTTLVLEGWEVWLATALREASDLSEVHGSEARGPDIGSDDRLRQAFVAELEALKTAEREHDMQIVLVMLEMGRGIVPLAAHDRRLRDLAGWLTQDAAARSEQVWYVWNGLVECLKAPPSV